MGVKYTIPYKDYFQNQCVIDISTDAYAGTPIIVRGVGARACEIVRDCDDDPYTTIVNTKANINIYQSLAYDVDILELQTAQDKEFRVTVTIAGVTEFIGFLVADGIQQTFKAAPFEINLTATDGLASLDTTTYSHNNLTGGRNIINFFRRILFFDLNLGLPLPIRWCNTIVNDFFNTEDDIFSGSMVWGDRGEGFTDYQGNRKSCLYILEGLLKCMQCRIVQSNGRWVIWRINDVVTGSFHMYETPATLDGFTITDLGIIDVNQTLGSVNRKTVMEDAILTVLPGLKTVKTTYMQEERDNVLPNGNMDIVDTLANAPIYWGFNADTNAQMESYVSLSNAYGNSVKITNAITEVRATFQLADVELPIDSDVLYTYINFGFKFMIIDGATLNEDGTINWDSTPMSFMLRYDDGVDHWYMNEYGFWTKQTTEVDVRVASLKLNDVAQIDFNAKQNIILPLPAVSPIGQTRYPSLYLGFFIPSGRIVVFDDIYLKVEDNNDVYETMYYTGSNTASEEYELNISSAHSGFYVSNLQTNFTLSGQQKFYSDSKASGVTLTEMNSNAILRNRYKASLVFEGSIYGNNYRYDEIYSIPQFPGKKFLPLRSTWNTETNVTNLTMVEIRDDGMVGEANHYGSNDKTNLSN